jgi:hypothetical protein
VRTLYQKYLQWAPANCGAWCKYAEVERSLGELERARAIYELAIEQPVLDMPEVLWKVRACATSSDIFLGLYTLVPSTRLDSSIKSAVCIAQSMSSPLSSLFWICPRSPKRRACG